MPFYSRATSIEAIRGVLRSTWDDEAIRKAISKKNPGLVPLLKDLADSDESINLEPETRDNVANVLSRALIEFANSEPDQEKQTQLIALAHSL